MQITIDKIAVSEYVQSYSETIEKVYDTANSFIASDGTEHKKCKGSRKKISLSLGNEKQPVTGDSQYCRKQLRLHT